jgi:nucleotide-binding universal stress UspA family protein
MIANVAASLDAALIVMGLGEHQLLDRALGTETALHTLRTASTPVLAVPQTYRFLPSRAVVGVDFGDAAVVGANEALALIPSLTRLSLVHVAPRWDLDPAAYKVWRTDYERSVARALERVRGEIDTPPGFTVTTVIREGKPTRELLRAADDCDADLIIVGSKGLGFLDRMLVGSTASGIVRGAHAAVFAFPIAALAQATAALASAAEETVDT